MSMEGTMDKLRTFLEAFKMKKLATKELKIIKIKNNSASIFYLNN